MRFLVTGIALILAGTMQLDAAFPLTLTLSLREREQHSAARNRVTGR